MLLDHSLPVLRYDELRPAPLPLGFALRTAGQLLELGIGEADGRVVFHQDDRRSRVFEEHPEAGFRLPEGLFRLPALRDVAEQVQDRRSVSPVHQDGRRKGDPGEPAAGTDNPELVRVGNRLPPQPFSVVRYDELSVRRPDKIRKGGPFQLLRGDPQKLRHVPVDEHEASVLKDENRLVGPVDGASVFLEQLNMKLLNRVPGRKRPFTGGRLLQARILCFVDGLSSVCHSFIHTPSSIYAESQ